MNKSTIVLLTLSAFVLGSLIGVGFSEGKSDRKIDEKSDSQQTSSASQISQAQNSQTNTGSENVDAQSNGGAPNFRFLAPGDLEVVLDPFDRAEPSAVGENYIPRQTAWKTETLQITLPMDGRIEYKALMQQGDSLVFDWKTDDGLVYTDFHGHDAAFGEQFFIRYEEQDGKQQSGMFVAAFSGEHGWYWLNMADKPVTITLRVAGFYSEIIKVDIESYQ